MYHFLLDLYKICCKVIFLCFDCVRIPGLLQWIPGIWWGHVALVLVVFSYPALTHLAVPHVDVMFLTLAGLLWEGGRAVGLTVDPREQQVAHLFWLCLM